MNEKEALEAIDGLLLGDGGLTKFLKGVRYSMCQSKHTISISDHLKWEYWLRDNVFATLGISSPVSLTHKTYSAGKKKGQKYSAAYLCTKRTPLLEILFDEWYDGGVWSAARGYEDTPTALYVRSATKTIPDRILNSSNLSPHLLTHWFLGDGGSHRRENIGSTDTVTTSLSTCGFTEQEVYRLVGILNDMGMSTGKPSYQGTKKGSGLVIYLTQDANDRFMHLIEPHIMEIFGDSVGLSYRDLVKYKHEPLASALSALRKKLGGKHG